MRSTSPRTWAAGARLPWAGARDQRRRAQRGRVPHKELQGGSLCAGTGASADDVGRGEGTSAATSSHKALPCNPIAPPSALRPVPQPEHVLFLWRIREQRGGNAGAGAAHGRAAVGQVSTGRALQCPQNTPLPHHVHRRCLAPRHCRACPQRPALAAWLPAAQGGAGQVRRAAGGAHRARRPPHRGAVPLQVHYDAGHQAAERE